VITGAHVILYSRNADTDREFIRKVLGFPHVDAGGGWLIFALPPAEIAVHPAESESHELYLMCDDIHALAKKMTSAGVAVSAIEQPRWGSLVHVTLPSGAKLGIYQPKHALAHRATRKAGSTRKVTSKRSRASKSSAPRARKPR
jgi:catechol 2,3-dioxygenase-like lactoylglutathione lyase family enzyme